MCRDVSLLQILLQVFSVKNLVFMFFACNASHPACSIKLLKVAMHADLALQMMASMLWIGLQICLPVLALTMFVGLLISIFQVVTQIQEMSLTFIPKLLAAGVALIVFGPWMLHKLSQFSGKLWSDIPAMF